MELKVIAHIHTDFREKFGLPRQSGLIPQLRGKIVFEPEYRSAEALRGLEGFSHIWLIWEFSSARREGWSPTVRPPRLGGNVRKGVFATRSPYRPNPLGLSCVRLEKIETEGSEGPVLYVSGVDMTDGTPVYDIKPYLPFADSVPEAAGGFTDEVRDKDIAVDIPAEKAAQLSGEELALLTAVLAHDPRPGYQEDRERIYGLDVADIRVRFRVEDGRAVVTEISRTRRENGRDEEKV